MKASDRITSLCKHCELKCKSGNLVVACGRYEPKKKGILWRLAHKRRGEVAQW